MTRWHRSSSWRDDSGQILVIVVILCSLLASVGPLMVSNLENNQPLVLNAANEHAALAAAESGVEWYRNQLDGNANYFQYSARVDPVGDPALTGWCGSSCDLGGSSPAESFYYVPNETDLFNTSGPDAGEMLLTVTGRAGEGGRYAYVTVSASYDRSSILDNAYFTQYEIIDPHDTFPSNIGDPSPERGMVSVCLTTGSCSYQPMLSYQVSYTYTNASAATVHVSTDLWDALCRYDSYSANTFVDSLLYVPNLPYQAQTGATADASPQIPYYGTYDQSQAFVYDVPGSSTTIAIPSQACGSPHPFQSPETFDGPIYSNDQVYISGMPQFLGGTATSPPYESGVSPATRYAWNVPDSVLVTSANSGANGPYASCPSSCGYAPKGTTVTSGDTDDAEYGSPGKPVMGGNETLPAFSTLDSNAQATGSDYGCVFSGPTMIELVTPVAGASGPTTMSVWSPLSSATAAGPVTQATSSACSSPASGPASAFSPSNPFITGIPLPANGVVYVNNYDAADQTALSSCFNPLQSNSLYSTGTYTAGKCYEGDVFVGGELSGQLSIGAAANVVISRPITYACADDSLTVAGANAGNPSGLPLCLGSVADDVLGLYASNDVLLSLPENSAVLGCSWDGYGTPTGTDTATVTVLGTTAVPEPGAIWPDCDNEFPLTGTSLTGMLVDAAIVAQQGSLGTQNFSNGPNNAADWTFYLNGSDISEYRGSFGSGNIGYGKHFSYDSRLAYLEPPDFLQTAVSVWKTVGFVACGSADTVIGAAAPCSGPS